MNKLFQKTTICLLSPSYFKTVMETASAWATLPYNIEYSQNAWYWKYKLMKVEGYFLIGFKVDWPEEKKPKTNVPSDMSELIDALITIQEAPIDRIFVSKEIFNKVRFIKSDACIVEVEEFGSAKTRHKDCGVTPHFCLFASSFVKELSDKEIRKLKSIGAFIVGIESFENN